MAEARVQILMPTFNHVRDLDVTMESIQKQDYDPENIFIVIVDFGSNDGTYEKAISYSGKNIGIYARPFQKNWRLRLSDAAEILDSLRVPGHGGGAYGFSMVLYPGDILYPGCLRELSARYIENYGLNPAALICESDILTDDGKTCRQHPLFSGNRVIDGCKDLCDYVNNGYKHQIFQITPCFERGRRSQRHNEGRSFHKLVLNNYGRNAVYIQEPLMATKRIAYEDEFQEILFRWEIYITITHICQDKPALYQGLISAHENLAEYALWRSFCLYQKKAGQKEIEDCFLISRVIASGIEEKKVYKDMKKLVIDKNSVVEKSLEQYFMEQ